MAASVTCRGEGLAVHRGSHRLVAACMPIVTIQTGGLPDEYLGFQLPQRSQYSKGRGDLAGFVESNAENLCLSIEGARRRFLVPFCFATKPPRPVADPAHGIFIRNGMVRMDVERSMTRCSSAVDIKSRPGFA